MNIYWVYRLIQQTYSQRWLWCAWRRWAAHRSRQCRDKHPCAGARCAPIPMSPTPGHSLQQNERAIEFTSWFDASFVAVGRSVVPSVGGSDLPSSVLLMTILWLSSRFHLMDGSGLPFALQRSVTLSPSRTMTSLEVSASSILGGTARSVAGQGNGYYYSCQLNINSKASSTWFKCKNFCILANSVAKKVETAQANKI